jgi:molybdopterin-guanine dinucleotide biosynthesis protein A
MTEILGAILVGGASSRMGENKALVEIAGHPMGTWVSQAVAAALPAAAPSVTLGSPPLNGLPHLEDHPGTGPLSGLAAVTDFCDQSGVKPEAVLLVAVDHPWTRPETLRALIARYQGRTVVPTHHRVRQVTCAVYPMSFVAAASKGATAGKGFQTLLDDMDVDEVSPEIWTDWGEDGRSWFSVDERQDIARGLERYGPPGA